MNYKHITSNHSRRDYYSTVAVILLLVLAFSVGYIAGSLGRIETRTLLLNDLVYRF